MLKGNIGEWSEFYAFLKILSDRKISAADSQLNPIDGKHIDVLEITRQEKKSSIKTYNIRDAKKIIIAENGTVTDSVPSDNLKKSVVAIFKELKNISSRTFSLTEAQDLLKNLRCSSLGAGSSKKSDVLLIIHDRITPVEIPLGFSIKSMIGAPATLLNAGKGTNFKYRVISEDTEDLKENVNEIKTKSSVRDRMEAIDAFKGKLIFKNIESGKFTANLRMLDIMLPEILAELVKSFYAGKGRTVKELVEATDFSKISRPEGFELKPEICKYKIKQFLAAVALGMTPEKNWSGLTEAQGGYIIVREDGELVCYHLYNRDEFQEYLYLNTKFETASTTRHDFGKIYKEGQESLINLNLQIRFVR